MLRMLSLLPVMALALLLEPLFLPHGAAACTCLTPPPPLESLAASDAVLSARVMDIALDENTRTLRVSVEVEAIWKGPETATLMLLSGADEGLCGYRFDQEQEYLIYASADEDGVLWASLCSRTRPLSEAGEDLRELGEPLLSVVSYPTSWGVFKAMQRQ